MLTLDPIKLLLVAVVALVVLGPDKLPAAARKASRLWAEVRALRDGLHSQLQAVAQDLPLAAEVRQAAGTARAAGALDLGDEARRVLARAVGATAPPAPEAPGGDADGTALADPADPSRN